ncbi:MAG TPA: flagellin [Candidatus Gastranaerophilales bacterium]|nr:flagellin [Candidatus Gastranaerophilales bacterium]
MSVVVNNNIASLIAQRNLNGNTDKLVKSIERLSSGYRINRASDDAAGLSISENLRAQIRGNAKAMNNIQDGINMLSIAEGGLSVIGENIQRIRELCVQAANATNATNEKTAILSEINARIQDINRISSSAQFNKLSLLDGTLSSAKLQIGAGSASLNVIDISTVLSTSADASAIGISLTATGATWSGDSIRSYLNNLDSALTIINSKRSELGAYQNRLESALENLSIMNENLRASESRIRDLDVAEESATMTKYQILQQASASVLAQANRLPQIALPLISG